VGLGVIKHHASTPIEQDYLVNDIQPLRCTEPNGIENTRISMLRISNTNLKAIDLKMDHQIFGRIILDSRKHKVVNPSDRDRKYSRIQVHGISSVHKSIFKRNDGIGRSKWGISLYVEVDTLGFHVDIINQCLVNWDKF